MILDEPTSYLDVKYKLEFLSILQEMKHQKKLTVIMSLHELDLAERISDQILCVNGTTPERFRNTTGNFLQKDIFRSYLASRQEASMRKP